MDARQFEAQLHLARITDEFYAAYLRYFKNIRARERARLARLPGAPVPTDDPRPLSRDELVEQVSRMSEEYRRAFAQAVARER
jgi:hypothetical protein